MNTTMLSFLILAILIIAFLAGYAVLLLIRIRAQTKRHQEVEQTAQKNWQEKKARINTDIIIIARAYIEEQVELPEACLRIYKLNNIVRDDNNLEQNSTVNQVELIEPSMSVFNEVSDKLSNIPTHDAWKALDKKTKAKFQKTLHQLSSDYHDAVKSACEKLITANKLH